MSKGDISLPNQSGQVDPRIQREAELRLQRAYLTKPAPKPQPKPTLASKLLALKDALK